LNNYQQAIECLYGLRKFGTKLGLNNIRCLLELLSHPEKGIDFYHIAGTNGKGSTAAILECLLRQEGKKTGRFTSPHLVDFRERIAIDSVPIAREEVIELIRELTPVILKVKQFAGCTHPTYFEVVTAMAALSFSRHKVKAAAWETGMGGSLDATNAIVPRVALITSIGVDHQAYLGNRIEEIAVEKAGIIKPGIPTVVGELVPKAMEQVRLICRSRGSRLIHASELFRAENIRAHGNGMVFDLDSPWGKLPRVEFSLYGRHQVSNCMVALAAWESAGGTGEGIVRKALRQVFWPSRRQSPLSCFPGRLGDLPQYW